MKSLLELRGQLDEIDQQLVDLYKQRMSICEEVGEYKIASGKKVFDKQREHEKLDAVSANIEDPFYKKGVVELFEQIMSVSRKLQYQLLTKKGALGRLPFIGVDKLDTENCRIVFQGTEGAYSQAAMEKYFGKETTAPSTPITIEKDTEPAPTATMETMEPTAPETQPEPKYDPKKVPLTLLFFQ